MPLDKYVTRNKVALACLVSTLARAAWHSARVVRSAAVMEPSVIF